MQTLINALTFNKKEERAMLLPMLPIPLANVPFHFNTAAISRFFAADFPVHLAVHEVSAVQTPPAEYTFPHAHEDHDEINIIISSEKLVYKILIGSNKYTVQNNSCIWIPRGALHSANVISGSGFFVTIRLA